MYERGVIHLRYVRAHGMCGRQSALERTRILWHRGVSSPPVCERGSVCVTHRGTHTNDRLWVEEERCGAPERHESEGQNRGGVCTPYKVCVGNLPGTVWCGKMRESPCVMYTVQCRQALTERRVWPTERRRDVCVRCGRVLREKQMFQREPSQTGVPCGLPERGWRGAVTMTERE